jgi:hypothetical protein
LHHPAVAKRQQVRLLVKKVAEHSHSNASEDIAMEKLVAKLWMGFPERPLHRKLQALTQKERLSHGKMDGARVGSCGRTHHKLKWERDCLKLAMGRDGRERKPVNNPNFSSHPSISCRTRALGKSR